MTEKPANPNRLVLTNDSAVGRITVDMEAFFNFSFWMAEELEDLVERWRHKTASRQPNFRRTQQRSQTP